MLLAARKGEGLSENDMEGLLEDLAKLERLDGEDGERMTAVTAAERILMGLGISDPEGNRSGGDRVEPRGARRIPSRSTAATPRSWARHGRP